MKNLKIDEDAHRILVGVRKTMEDKGIENPNLSDAIRELDSRPKGSNQATKSRTPHYKCEALDEHIEEDV